MQFVYILALFCYRYTLLLNKIIIAIKCVVHNILYGIMVVMVFNLFDPLAVFMKKKNIHDPCQLCQLREKKGFR